MTAGGQGGTGESASTIAERVAWLFEVVTAALPSHAEEGGDTGWWRPYTDHEVGLAVGEALGLGPRDGVSLVERVRGGQQADDRSLVALARVFGAGAEFFGEDLAAVRAEQERLLVRALRDSAVWTVALCRSPALAGDRRRVRLKRLLNLLREGQERPDGLAGAEKRSDTVKTRSSDVGAWQHSGSDGGCLSGQPFLPGERSGEVDVTPLSGRALRQLCVRLLRDLDIVPPLTPELLCQRLGDQRGRRIKLRAEEVFTTSSVGHLICKPRHDIIIYQRTAPRLLQAHVIYHEVIHLIRGHLDGSESLTCGALDPAAVGEPGLYSHWQEWEAETGATVLTELARTTADPRALGSRTSGPAGGLAATFGMRPGGWPT